MLLEYKVEKAELLDALNDIEEFEEKMVTFMEKYPSYRYNLKIDKATSTNPNWVVNLTIEKDERTDIKDTT